MGNPAATKRPGSFLFRRRYGAPCSKEAIDPGRVDGRVQFPRVPLVAAAKRRCRSLTVTVSGATCSKAASVLRKDGGGVRFPMVPDFAWGLMFQDGDLPLHGG